MEGNIQKKRPASLEKLFRAHERASARLYAVLEESHSEKADILSVLSPREVSRSRTLLDKSTMLAKQEEANLELLVRPKSRT